VTSRRDRPTRLSLVRFLGMAEMPRDRFSSIALFLDLFRFDHVSVPVPFIPTRGCLTLPRSRPSGFGFVGPVGARWSLMCHGVCNTPVLRMHLAPANHEHKHCHAFISIT
jgi:hypothetical protein